MVPVPLTLSAPAVCLQNWKRGLFAAKSGRTEGRGKCRALTEDDSGEMRQHTSDTAPTTCDSE